MVTTNNQRCRKKKRFKAKHYLAFLLPLLLLFLLNSTAFAQTNCEDAPCAQAAEGNGPDPCDAKLYCSNSDAVDNGFISCTPAADTDGCGVDGSIAALPDGETDDFLSATLPANCYSTGDYVQWIAFLIPDGVNQIKIQGVGGELDSWAVYWVPDFTYDDNVPSYEQDFPCDESDLDLLECSDQNQYEVITNEDYEDGISLYYIALIYDQTGNGTINFKVKECEFVEFCEPQIVCPDDAVVSCDDEQGILDWLDSAGSESCGLNTEITSTLSGFDGCVSAPSETFDVTFTLRNSDTGAILDECTASITITDDPPSVSCPPDITVDCTASTDPADTGMATCIDDCSPDSSPTYTDSVDDSDPCALVISRSWVCTDDCENVSDPCVQTITVVDDTAPEVTCPDDITVDCGASTDPSNTGTATCGDDDCNPAGGQPTYTDSVDDSDPCAVVITRTWTCADACGNSTECVQLITVIVDTPPEVICPDDITIDCSASTDPSNTGTATCGVDDCIPAGGQPTYSDSVDDSNPCAVIITRTWTCADACGNSTECVQIITVIDDTPPAVTCPDDITIDCGASIDPLITGMATCDDDDCNGADGQPTYSDSVDNSNPCAVVITRTWTCADACGNSTECVQLITVIDDTPPEVICPDDVTIDCGASSDPSNTGTATCGNDDCNGAGGQPTYTDSVDDSDPCAVVITRTWTCADACGNSSECVQTITVIDDTPPQVTCPDDVTIDCGESSDPSNTGMATCGDDDCSPAGGQPTYTDSVDDSDPCAVVITRTWTCADACGNSTECVQTITVIDDTPPQVTCPDDVTIDCGESSDPSNTGMATCGDDDCSPAGGQPTYTDSVDDSDACAVVITRTWTCADACGNSTECVQTITIVDDTAPVGECPEGADDLACPDELPTPESLIELIEDAYTDECDNGVIVNFLGDDGETACVEGRFSRTYRFEVCDDCGNCTPCEITFSGVCEFCTLTQGGWGNAGGKYPWNDGDGKATTTEILEALFDAYGPLVIGLESGNSLTITDPECVIDLLPGNGNPGVLPPGDASATDGNDCEPYSSQYLSNNGRLKNNLATQVIALQLNIWYSLEKSGADLAGLEFGSACLPISLGGLPSSIETVGDLLDYANLYLSGALGDSKSLAGALTQAVSSVNEYFDGCGSAGNTGTIIEPTAETNLPPNRGQGKLRNLTIQPNPTSNQTMIVFETEDEENVSLRILDLQGNEVHQRNYPIIPGSNQLQVMTNELPSGTYLVSIRQGDVIINRRLVIVRP